MHEYQQQGLKTVIVRPAAIYGPGDPERFGMIQAVAKGSFPIFGSESLTIRFTSTTSWTRLKE